MAKRIYEIGKTYGDYTLLGREIVIKLYLVKQIED